MALYIDGDGQARDVCGGDLARDAERGRLSAESLRADAERVDPFQRGPLDLGNVLARVLRADLSRERLFREESARVEGAADPHAHVNGRAGLASRKFHRLSDRVENARLPFCGGEHVHARHVFAAEPLGEKGQGNLISRNDLGMQGGGRVVRRVFAGERVADALAETRISSISTLER